mgnify:CR=1 FL=1
MLLSGEEDPPYKAEKKVPIMLCQKNTTSGIFIHVYQDLTDNIQAFYFLQNKTERYKHQCDLGNEKVDNPHQNYISFWFFLYNLIALILTHFFTETFKVFSYNYFCLKHFI